jgi:hypothetical protein
MPKAIKINTENKRRLEQQYDMEEDELVGKEGLYLVADFGDATPVLGLITQEWLDRTFDRTGKDLLNGYFEIMKKAA